MKATMQIPDEMYREVKAKSALQGRSVRSVTIMLYTSWLRGLVDESELNSPVAEASHLSGTKPNLACFSFGRQFVRKNADGPHDMASIRTSIATVAESGGISSARKKRDVSPMPELAGKVKFTGDWFADESDEWESA